jgi:lipopolysaccharide transport system ATP-binding protein
MSNDIILKVENVSKLYRLGTVGTGTFRGDVHRFWKTKVLGQEDPFLKIGQTNDRTSKEKAEFVWALKDINFEVKSGEVLGIIGKNGAGKSTLLKLLSRITSPTTGSIKSAGRMASLLEVGTGFHPELTGRENIYLNGAILGMTKKEIQSKFDEMVDFSGCELYIDTPVKRYSSGMTVRLGFAVAAFLDPEILVVDEVLAVGDAEFQKKAIGKMKNISHQEGRTVLFVSHNLNSVAQLCNRGMVLENGGLLFNGTVSDAINTYIDKTRYNGEYKKIEYPLNKNKEINLRFATFLNVDNLNENFIYTADEDILFRMNFTKNSSIKGIYMHLLVEDENGNILIETDSWDQELNYFDTDKIGLFELDLYFSKRIFKTGKYSVTIGLASKQANKFQIESYSNFIGFEVKAESFIRDSSRIAMTSYVPKTICKWRD